jgi:hypothetical protein
MTTQKLCPFIGSVDDTVESRICDSDCALYSEDYKKCSLLLLSESVASVLKPIIKLKND